MSWQIFPIFILQKLSKTFPQNLTSCLQIKNSKNIHQILIFDLKFIYSLSRNSHLLSSLDFDTLFITPNVSSRATQIFIVKFRGVNPLFADKSPENLPQFRSQAFNLIHTRRRTKRFHDGKSLFRSQRKNRLPFSTSKKCHFLLIVDFVLVFWHQFSIYISS
jgi:hypothetical protein